MIGSCVTICSGRRSGFLNRRGTTYDWERILDNGEQDASVENTCIHLIGTKSLHEHHHFFHIESSILIDHLKAMRIVCAPLQIEANSRSTPCSLITWSASSSLSADRPSIFRQLDLSRLRITATSEQVAAHFWPITVNSEQSSQVWYASSRLSCSWVVAVKNQPWWWAEQYAIDQQSSREAIGGATWCN